MLSNTLDPIEGCKSTLAGWIKRVLFDAGIDTGFTAHSTRGAGSSNAAKQGVPVDSILRQADLANESTFVRVYLRNAV